MLLWPKDHDPGFEARRCEIVRNIEPNDLSAGSRWDTAKVSKRSCTKMYKISIIVVLFLFCLAPQAKAGDITIKNENCVWQGFARTNQAKFHVYQTMRQLSRDYSDPMAKLPSRCTDEWLTIRAGSTVTVKVEQFYDNDSDLYTGVKVGPAMDCFYSVHSEGQFLEGLFGGDQNVRGTKGQKFACRLSGGGVCGCRTQ